MWGKNVGMPQHPDWYPGMTEDSPLSEWQFVAYNTTYHGSKRVRKRKHL